MNQGLRLLTSYDKEKYYTILYSMQGNSYITIINGVLNNG